MRRPEVDTATHMATRLCALLNLCVAFFFRFHITLYLFEKGDRISIVFGFYSTSVRKTLQKQTSRDKQAFVTFIYKKEIKLNIAVLKLEL